MRGVLCLSWTLVVTASKRYLRLVTRHERICCPAHTLQWVVDGSSTMLKDTDRQIQEACGREFAMCLVPVGVGSIAHVVASHYALKKPWHAQFDCRA